MGCLTKCSGVFSILKESFLGFLSNSENLTDFHKMMDTGVDLPLRTILKIPKRFTVERR